MDEVAELWEGGDHSAAAGRLDEALAHFEDAIGISNWELLQQGDMRNA